MQTTEDRRIASVSAQDYARVKSYLEELGAPFYDADLKRHINSTPVVDITEEVARFSGDTKDNKFYMKLEYKNRLTASVKGRPVASMVLRAVRDGSIYNKSGDKKLWIEPTSGNTGKGLAEIAKLLGVEFTAVFSRLDVSEEIRAHLDRYGAKIITVGSEYSLGDLESLAEKRGLSVAYYWSNFGGASEETQSLVTGKVAEERKKYNETTPAAVLKEVDGNFLLDKLLPLGLEASNTPIIARAEKGEFDGLKKDLFLQFPELSDPKSIVAFVCPIGNTSMVISSLLNQLGFSNVCNIQGGAKSLRTEEGVNSASSEYCPVPGASITRSSIEFVKKLVKENQEEYFTFMQYDNGENVLAHETTTGPELDQEVRAIDYVVCTFGTGGTATGLAKYFAGKKTKVLVAFPDRPVEGIRTLRGVDGLAFFKPELYARVIETNTRGIEQTLSYFGKKGLGFGPSTAVALSTAINAAKNETGKSFVIVAADGIENYESEYKNIL